MPTTSATAATRTIQVILVMLCLIAGLAATRNMLEGVAVVQPAGVAVSPDVDDVYRYLSGLYLGLGVISLWIAFTIERHDTLIYLVALTCLLGGSGRVISRSPRARPPRGSTRTWRWSSPSRQSW